MIDLIDKHLMIWKIVIFLYKFVIESCSINQQVFYFDLLKFNCSFLIDCYHLKDIAFNFK